jgi:hypothetical protein
LKNDGEITCQGVARNVLDKENGHHERKGSPATLHGKGSCRSRSSQRLQPLRAKDRNGPNAQYPDKAGKHPQTEGRSNAVERQGEHRQRKKQEPSAAHCSVTALPITQNEKSDEHDKDPPWGMS